MEEYPIIKRKRPKKNIRIERKERSDKKVFSDIRVPVSLYDREYIMYCSRSKKQSMTEFCTEIVKINIEEFYEFPELTYTTSDYIVHVKADKEVYERIVYFSVSWNCSIREATYRILTNALFYLQGGVYINDKSNY
ncbi:hypothetical protein [Bacillus sp. FJAT-45350]|uniref:hypothetical protein n=1 Tax=Bacillus sp. FJAT-45350 TaxID=2011014 RepID=UPI000BB868E9|nr:hypothetical protein [Bacillus sp. FJAT-45350]